MLVFDKRIPLVDGHAEELFIIVFVSARESLKSYCLSLIIMKSRFEMLFLLCKCYDRIKSWSRYGVGGIERLRFNFEIGSSLCLLNLNLKAKSGSKN